MNNPDYEKTLADYDAMEVPRKRVGLGLMHGMMEPCRACLHPRLMHREICEQKLNPETGIVSAEPCGCVAHLQESAK